MNFSQLRNLIKRVINEAGEDPSKKTKTKVKDDKFDPFEPRIQEPIAKVQSKDDKKKVKQPYSRKGPSIDQLKSTTSSISAEDMLTGTVDDDFDFDEEFKKGQEAPARNIAPANVMRGEEDEDFPFEPGEPKKTILRFQPNAAAVIDPDGIRVKKHVAKDIGQILMDEFYAPAMSLGQNILPSVWMEMTKLARKDPMRFKRQFGAALHQIRELENHWFSNLLGIDQPPVTFQPADPEDMEMRERIVYVLEKYYKAVLENASRNSQNLIDELQTVAASMSREEFETLFFEALKATRDVEDEAFKNFMR